MKRDIRLDARGVVAAPKLIEAIEQRRVISLNDIKTLSRAVINRYDGSEESARMSSVAQMTLNCIDSSIILCNVEQLARWMIREDQP